MKKIPERQYVPDWTEQPIPGQDEPREEYTDLEELQDEERRYERKERL